MREMELSEGSSEDLVKNQKKSTCLKISHVCIMKFRKGFIITFKLITVFTFY